MKRKYFKNSKQYFKWYEKNMFDIEIYTIKILFNHKYNIRVYYKEV